MLREFVFLFADRREALHHLFAGLFTHHRTCLAFIFTRGTGARRAMNFFRRIREPRPKYGDFRIVREELRNGDVTFIIERYHKMDPRLDLRWQLPRARDHLPAWTFESAEEAQAAIDACLAKERGEELVSRSVVEPPSSNKANTPSKPEHE